MSSHKPPQLTDPKEAHVEGHVTQKVSVDFIHELMARDARLATQRRAHRRDDTSQEHTDDRHEEE